MHLVLVVLIEKSETENKATQSTVHFKYLFMSSTSKSLHVKCRNDKMHMHGHTDDVRQTVIQLNALSQI